MGSFVLLVSLLALQFAAALAAGPVPVFKCTTTLKTTPDTAIDVPSDAALELDEGASADLVCNDELDAVVYTLDCPKAVYLQSVPKDEADYAFIALLPVAEVASRKCRVQMHAVSKMAMLADTAVTLGRLVPGNPIGMSCNASTPPDALEFATPTYLPRRKGVWPRSDNKPVFVLPYASHHLACDPAFVKDPPMFRVPTLTASAGQLENGALSHTVGVPLDDRLLKEHQETQIKLTIANGDDSVGPATDDEEHPAKQGLKGMLISLAVFGVGAVIGVVIYRRRALKELNNVNDEHSSFRSSGEGYYEGGNGYGTLL